MTMPSITLEMIDHVVFLVLVALGPWNGRRRFDLLVKAVDAGDPNARTGAYRTVVVEKGDHRGDRRGVDRPEPERLIDRVDCERHAPVDRRLRPHRTGNRRAADACPIRYPQRAGPPQDPRFHRSGTHLRATHSDREAMVRHAMSVTAGICEEFHLPGVPLRPTRSMAN